MTKHEIARGVAAQLFEAENALDDAIMAFSRLTTTALEARGELNLSAVLGGEVIERGAAVHARLATARTEAVALHAALAELAARIRVRAEGEDGDPGDGFGAGDKHSYPKGAAAPPLRAVRAS